jgi:enoyl-CoA hydratase
MKHLKLEKNGPIAVVTFSRPEALNALNKETLLEINQLLDEVAMDETLRTIVFTGEGKAFIAGADIKEMAGLSAEEGRKFGAFGQAVFAKLEKLEKVTIAAVNGFALGGGCELAMSCDLRLASPKAKFGQPEVSLGITPGFSGTQRLPKLVGVAKAKELIFTGKIISADEAERMGLVNRVCTEDVLSEAIAMATQISEMAPLAVRYSKIAIDSGLTEDIFTGSVIEANVFGLCFATQDQKNGMNAFIEKQKTTFEGK